jgi:type I restriction enzyme S subunit
MLTRRGDFDSNWLCYAFNSPSLQAQFDIVKYGATQQQFNISHAVEFVFPVPPRHEQSLIAASLKERTAEIDNLAANCERAISLLQERRSVLISAAVTGKIDVRNYTPKEMT